MPTRRRILKQVVVWTAGVVLLSVWYVVAAPFIVFPAEEYFPASRPVLEFAYAPLMYVVDHPEVPGHDVFVAYVNWCDDRFRETFSW
ncbi:MAG: hypothetical protein U0992_06430 [Planctomycetaceae bacterium]